jgi:hypothetical protein
MYALRVYDYLICALRVFIIILCACCVQVNPKYFCQTVLRLYQMIVITVSLLEFLQ